MQAQLLNQSHIDLVRELFEKREKFSKQEKNKAILDRLMKGNELALKDGVTNRLVGVIEDNTLKSIVAQSFYEIQAFWIMHYWATDLNNNLIKSYGPYLEAAFQKAMGDAEQRKCYDFWVSVPEAYASVGPRLQSRSPNWSRYEVYTDAIIPPNKFPKFRAHRDAYGMILKPHTVYIRHAVLKQQFREENLTPRQEF